MFIGNFAMGVATKRIAPAMPIWILLLAPQFMDILFVPLIALGIEGMPSTSAYGERSFDILYTHSLGGALAIAATAYWLGNRYWQESRGGIILAGLSLSHSIIDLFVHHSDMAIPPSNLGGSPLLGFGLWSFAYSVFVTEVVMAIVAAVLYAYWAQAENKSARWFIGPTLIGVFFAVLLVLDIPNLPRL